MKLVTSIHVLVQIVLLLAVSINAIQVERYDNQTRYNEAKTQLEACAKQYNVTAKLYAATDASWEMRVDQNQNYTEEVKDNVWNCVTDKYAIVSFAPESDLIAQDDEETLYSSEGPDSLPSVPQPIVIWPSQYTLEEVQQILSQDNGWTNNTEDISKRVGSVSYYVYTNKDLGGSLRFSGTLGRYYCLTITGTPVAKSIRILNSTDCPVSTRLWPHHNCIKNDSKKVTTPANNIRETNRNIYSLKRLN